MDATIVIKRHTEGAAEYLAEPQIPMDKKLED